MPSSRTGPSVRSPPAMPPSSTRSSPSRRSGGDRGVAREAGCRLVGLWLSTPPETLIERVDSGRVDASDANRRVVKEQLGYDLGEITWHTVDTSGTPEKSLADVRQALIAAGITLAG